MDLFLTIVKEPVQNRSCFLLDCCKLTLLHACQCTLTKALKDNMLIATSVFLSPISPICDCNIMLVQLVNSSRAKKVKKTNPMCLNKTVPVTDRF